MDSRTRKQDIRVLAREREIPRRRAATLYDRLWGRDSPLTPDRAAERKALEALQEKVRLARSAVASDPTERGLLDLARDLRVLANSLRSYGDLAHAEAVSEEALGVVQRLQTPLAEVLVLYRCARNEARRRQWQAAEAAYSETLRAAEEAGEDLAMAFVLGDLARMHARTGNDTGEVDAARNALARYVRLGAVSAEDALRELGRQVEKSWPAGALDWSRRALGGGREFPSGIYPWLGMQALSFRHGAINGPWPGPETVAEMARLRVERGEAAGPLVTEIPDLGLRDSVITERFEDVECEVGLMAE